MCCNSIYLSFIVVAIPHCCLHFFGEMASSDIVLAESPTKRTRHGLVAPVSCLADTFTWPRFALDAVSTSAVADLSSMIGDITLSSAFSGVDTPGVAMNMICRELDRQSFYTKRHRIAASLCAVEYDTEAAIELRLVPDGPQCIHSDITGFASKDNQHMLKMDTDFSYDRLSTILLKPGAVRLASKCIVHGCDCTHRRADLHIAGTPCTDFSNMGSLNKENGRTTAYFLIWAHLRRLLREPRVICENVEGFLVWLLEVTLGMVYDIHTVVLDNDIFGLAVRRRRRYTLMTLRGLVLMKQPYTKIPEMFKRDRSPSHTWRDYMVASPGEKRAELLWSHRRPTSQANLDGICCDSSSSMTRDMWVAGLTQAEQGRLTQYLADPDAADKACFILTTHL